MLKIRSQRIGRKNSPFFRIVIIDRKTSLTGSTIDVIGYHNPQKKIFYFNFKKFLKWNKNGAKLNPLIASLYNQALYNLYESGLF